jgi:hypothetical protein
MRGLTARIAVRSSAGPHMRFTAAARRLRRLEVDSSLGAISNPATAPEVLEAPILAGVLGAVAGVPLRRSSLPPVTLSAVLHFPPVEWLALAAPPEPGIGSAPRPPVRIATATSAAESASQAVPERLSAAEPELNPMKSAITTPVKLLPLSVDPSCLVPSFQTPEAPNRQLRNCPENQEAAEAHATPDPHLPWDGGRERGRLFAADSPSPPDQHPSCGGLAT